MKIYVGTKNQIKINAVKESITNYSIFCEAIVFEKEVSSDILDQPKSLDETIK
jgi:non-canonical (house-cleaning) NTP pyrophosphatase